MTESEAHRYRCSNCGEDWQMDDLPVSCPHCGGEVVGGWRKIVYREVGVRDPRPGNDDELPEFEELHENDRGGHDA